MEQDMLEVQPPQIFEDNRGKFPVRFMGPETQSIVYSTLNGGNDWKTTAAIESSGPVNFVSLQSGFSWDGGRIFGTLDGGMTWNRIPPDEDFSQSLLQYQFVSSNRGWCLALNDAGKNSLYSKENSGYSWRKLP
jgi:hypothetical protein